MKINKEKQGKGSRIQVKGGKEQGAGSKHRNLLAIKCAALRRSGVWMTTCCCLLVIFSALFVSCENTIISDWYEGEDPVLQGIETQVSTLMPVTAWALTNLVPAPFNGGTPVTSFAGPQYTGGVEWYLGPTTDTSHSGVFGSGQIYTAVVTLTAAAGRSLSGVGANAFPPAGAPPPDGSVTNAEGSGVVTIVFPATGIVSVQTVSDTDLSTKITTPVSYGAPQGSVVVPPQYRGNIVWRSTLEGTDPGTAFLPAVAYTATVTLTADSGWTFGPSPGFTYSGAVSSTTVDNMDGTITVTIDFLPTGSRTITDLALTYNVPAPVYGSTPVTSFGGPQYVGTVDWYNVTDGTSHLGTTSFDPGKVYKATVTLTAKAGWTFVGVGANTFSHNGAPGSVTNTTVSLPDDQVTVTITFLVTGSTPVITVTDLALTFNVPAPFAYGSPVTSFTGSQYTGMVEWYVGEGTGGAAHSGLFHTNTIYTAKVTMLPLAGWTFTGVLANTFTHQAVAPGKITHAANSQVVTIKFPKTGATVW
jgi:hypothetical protein